MKAVGMTANHTKTGRPDQLGGDGTARLIKSGANPNMTRSESRPDTRELLAPIVELWPDGMPAEEFLALVEDAMVNLVRRGEITEASFDLQAEAEESDRAAEAFVRELFPNAPADRAEWDNWPPKPVDEAAPGDHPSTTRPANQHSNENGGADVMAGRDVGADGGPDAEV